MLPSTLLILKNESQPAVVGFRFVARVTLALDCARLHFEPGIVPLAKGPHERFDRSRQFLQFADSRII